MLITPLFEEHQHLGAKMVDFAGWQMPLHYGSQLEEHHWVRNDAGIFDVSHMLCIDIQGKDAQPFLRHLLANDIQKLTAPGKALYSCLLNPQGGVMDDLIVYRLETSLFRCVVNAGTRDKDIAWIKQQAQSFEVDIRTREDLGIIAIQGPQTLSKIEKMFPENDFARIRDLKPFHSTVYQDWLIARTGYTGEDGIEVILPRDALISFWQALVAAELKPIGLGARDTLRLEAGFNLYGADMDELHTPDESNVSWTVDLKDPEREFIGKSALMTQRQQGTKKQLVGMILLDKGVCRPGMLVYAKGSEGHEMPLGKLTSGGFSPILSCGIGLARIEIGDASTFYLDIRGKKCPLKMVKPPFIKNGKANF